MTTVYRQPANRQGDTIVSSVLTDVASRVERGTQEINKEQPDKILETIRCFDTSFLAPKSVATITANGATVPGFVTSFSLQIRATAVSASVILEAQK